MNSIPMKISSI